MKIIIVGAGPVGLLTAVTLKLKYPKYNIIIYEKRKKYVRKQVVLIPYGILWRSGLELVDEEIIKESCFKDILPSQNYQSLCLKENNRYIRYSHIYIQINELEKILLKLVNKYKIKVIYKELNEKNLPKYDILIGCEGRKSFVREKILKSKFIKTPYFHNYALILIFNAKNNEQIIITKKKMKYIDDFFNFAHRDSLRQKKFLFEQNRIRFFRGPNKNAYLALQISKKEYESVKNTKKYKNLTPYFKRIITKYLNFYNCIPEKKLDNYSVSICPITINLSEKKFEIINNKIVGVLGDSSHIGSFFSGNNLVEGFYGVYSITDDVWDTGISDIYKKITKKNIKDVKKRLVELNEDLEFRQQWLKRTSEKTNLPFKIIDDIEKKIDKKDLISNINRGHELLQDSFDHKLVSRLSTFTKKELCYFIHPKIIQWYSYLFRCENNT